MYLLHATGHYTRRFGGKNGGMVTRSDGLACGHVEWVPPVVWDAAHGVTNYKPMADGIACYDFSAKQIVWSHGWNESDPNDYKYLYYPDGGHAPVLTPNGMLLITTLVNGSISDYLSENHEEQRLLMSVFDSTSRELVAGYSRQTSNQEITSCSLPVG